VIHTEEIQMGCDCDISGSEKDRLGPKLGFGYVTHWYYFPGKQFYNSESYRWYWERLLHPLLLFCIFLILVWK